jgi:thiol-disulfide isomerase/thioredoxin
MARLVLAALLPLFWGCDPGGAAAGPVDAGPDLSRGQRDVASAPDASDANDASAAPDSAADSEADAARPGLADAAPDGALADDSAQTGSPHGPAHCPAAPSGVTPGFDLGDQLAPRTFKNCDGEPVSLDAYCGARGLWLFFAHGWCPHCQKTAGFMEGVVTDYAGAGLVGVNILMETGSGGVPDAGSCREWRDTFGLERAVTLYDDTGASAALWDTPYTALSVFVDRDRVIVHKAHSDDEAQIRGMLELVLGIGQ